MKPYKKDFINNGILRSLVIGAIPLFCVPNMAFSASDNGCGVSSNSYINPEIALCSTHVYNIRQTKNPSDATSKQAMRDVIALKTTLMTQQLEQQYDFLEATVSRLKTQLQKAVLTTNLEAAGASSSSSSGGIAGIAENGVSGAENCRSGTTIDVMASLDDIKNSLRTSSSPSIVSAKLKVVKEGMPLNAVFSIFKQVDGRVISVNFEYLKPSIPIFSI